MKKQLALVAAALCLVACDGPAGPPGPAGKDGKAGADGKAPTADEVARALVKLPEFQALVKDALKAQSKPAAKPAPEAAAGGNSNLQAMAQCLSKVKSSHRLGWVMSQLRACGRKGLGK